jgi:hypothetical protein
MNLFSARRVASSDQGRGWVIIWNCTIYWTRRDNCQLQYLLEDLAFDPLAFGIDGLFHSMK